MRTETINLIEGKEVRIMLCNKEGFSQAFHVGIKDEEFFISPCGAHIDHRDKGESFSGNGRRYHGINETDGMNG